MNRRQFFKTVAATAAAAVVAPAVVRGSGCPAANPHPLPSSQDRGV